MCSFECDATRLSDRVKVAILNEAQDRHLQLLVGTRGMFAEVKNTVIEK